MSKYILCAEINLKNPVCIDRNFTSHQRIVSIMGYEEYTGNEILVSVEYLYRY